MIIVKVSIIQYTCSTCTYEYIDGHGREVCRARGESRGPPRFLEANVKSLIFTIGAPPDL